MVTPRGLVSNPHDAQRLDIVPGAASVRAPLKAHRDLDVQDLAQEPVRDVAELLADDGHRPATMNAIDRHFSSRSSPKLASRGIRETGMGGVSASLR